MIGIINGLRFCEIHVPRTGGTSRKEALLAAGATTLGNHTDHVTATRLREWFPKLEATIWTVRRNPCEIAVSLYHHLRNQGADNPHAVPMEMSFVDWMETRVFTNPKDFAELRNHSEWWLFQGQIVPVIVPYEDLASRWESITAVLGTEAPLPVLNATGAGENWRDYFTAEHYHRYLERFSTDREILGWPKDWVWN
jgi:hypothetical protein